MPFDFELAIADLDRRGFGNAFAPTRDGLRDKYPELKFLFDELDDHRYDVDQYGSAEDATEEKQEAQDEARTFYDLCEELEGRFAQIRDMVNVIARMDAADGILNELETLERLADEAERYSEQQREKSGAF